MIFCVEDDTSIRDLMQYTLNKEAKRASMAHLCFNVIGSGIWLVIFWGVTLIFRPAILDSSASIIRMQQGSCGIEAGFVWSDLLTNIERISDHCSNIAGCVIDMNHGNLNLHASLRAFRQDDGSFAAQRSEYAKKYELLLQK